MKVEIYFVLNNTGCHIVEAEDVLLKRFSTIMHQVFRKPLMPKCNSKEVALQITFYGKHLWATASDVFIMLINSYFSISFLFSL